PRHRLGLCGILTSRCVMEPVQNDRRTWDAQTVDRMLRMKRAQQAGMFHEAFEDMFPPEDSSEHAGDEQKRSGRSREGAGLTEVEGQLAVRYVSRLPTRV